MNRHTFEALAPALQSGIADPGERPGLLCSGDDIEGARMRVRDLPEFSQRVIKTADDILSDAGFARVETEPFYLRDRLMNLVDAQMLQPDRRYEAAILEMLMAFAEAPKWVAHVHGAMKCDHCSANTAAAMVLAMEVLGPELHKHDEEFLTDRIYDRCLSIFLRCCEERSEFWAERSHEFNWRMMTCGEGGLAALGLRGIPDRDQMVEFALEGVADVLDRVPAEGDWEEGPGYWSSTLRWGLRFALALKRATDGRVDLFQHPTLEKVADYFIHVTQPDGTVFNYADCRPNATSTGLHLLAREVRQAQLAWTVRKMGHESFWDLVFDDPDLASEQPADRERSAVFPTSGIALTRSDWSDEALFVGFKTGPTRVGHSHLDIQSFVVTKGSRPLVVDSGIWPYAHFLNFGDTSGPRWEFDNNATIGHNAVLVDGQGQSYGGAGTFLATDSNQELSWFVSDGSDLYPGLLDRYERWVVFVVPDVVLVYDDLAADVPRHWEWVVHPGGHTVVDRTRLLIDGDGETLSVKRLMPAADVPWRNTVDTRTTYYQDSNALEEVERSVHPHRCGPLFPCERVEFLWAMQLGSSESLDWGLDRESETSFVVTGDGAGRNFSVRFDRAARKCSMMKDLG